MSGLYPWWSLSVKVHPDTGGERGGTRPGDAHGVKEVGTFVQVSVAFRRYPILAARALRTSFPFLSTSVPFLSSSRFSQADDIEPLIYSNPWEFHPGVSLQTLSEPAPYWGTLPLLLS